MNIYDKINIMADIKANQRLWGQYTVSSGRPKFFRRLLNKLPLAIRQNINSPSYILIVNYK